MLCTSIEKCISVEKRDVFKIIVYAILLVSALTTWIAQREHFYYLSLFCPSIGGYISVARSDVQMIEVTF